jgi:hypothetical protein
MALRMPISFVRRPHDEIEVLDIVVEKLPINRPIRACGDQHPVNCSQGLGYVVTGELHTDQGASAAILKIGQNTSIDSLRVRDVVDLEVDGWPELFVYCIEGEVRNDRCDLCGRQGCIGGNRYGLTDGRLRGGKAESAQRGLVYDKTHGTALSPRVRR